jgi:hypothetical protein
LLENKPIFRGACNSIILRILSRIAVVFEDLLLVELKRAMLAYGGKRQTLLIGHL